MKINLDFIKANKKTLNIFTYIICSLYLLTIICFVFVDYNTNLGIENRIEEMMLHAESVNRKIEENLIFEGSNEDGNISTEPLFTDGKTALITAYNNAINSKSYYIEAIGSMTMNMQSMGISLKIATNTQIYKYSENKLLENRINMVLESNAGMFDSLVKSLGNNCVKTLKENGNNVRLKTSNVYLENNLPQANYSNAKREQNVEQMMVGENLYIINEDTVKEITYFKIKYKNGVPYEYHIQANMDIKCAEKFAEVIRDGAEAASIKYNSCTILAVVGANGNIKSLTAIDDATIDKMGMSCPLKQSQTIVISGTNEEITYVDKDI